jgi:dTDP-4-amino-4,6-dideoxygalactose transaminase
MKVPFLDLQAQYGTIRDEINDAVMKVIDSCAFSGGPFVQSFEKEFAQYCNTKAAVGVSSGTSALGLVLWALGIGEGDEVITVPDTFIATVEAISYVRAKPVFVDVDPRTYNIDTALIEKAITKKTKAIIPVHLFGQTSDMDPIMAIAQKHDLYVLEDACQAHGAQYKGKKAGSIGVAGAFSYYPGKNLGAYGEGGGITSNDEALVAKIRKFRDHGQAQKYYHDIVGWNDRLDGIQGAVLSAKLKHLEQWNDARRAHAALYKKILAGTKGITLPHEAEGNRHIYHLYVIQVDDRDRVIDELKKKEIFCGIHYPVPVHLQKAYDFLGYEKGSFPVAEKAAERFVSLPMFAELTDEQITFVAEQLATIVG